MATRSYLPFRHRTAPIVTPGQTSTTIALVFHDQNLGASVRAASDAGAFRRLM
ncbi:hypothetical protein ACFUAC_02320 [Streptomyces sp. NPDC057148]|uniref:hypothetical protein n=1 Tax=unclassified Streptomyces TaxID=2593676 RepID=UPI00362C6451